MLSSTVLLPELGVGLAVMTNKLPNSAFLALTNTLIDRFCSASKQDWPALYAEVEEEGRQAQARARQKREESRVAGTQPGLPLERTAGVYASDLLGEATVSRQNGGLVLQLAVHPSYRGRLEHWHYDTYRCIWDDPVLGDSLVPFISDGQGHAAEFRVTIREDWIDPLEHVFKRRPEAPAAATP